MIRQMISWMARPMVRVRMSGPSREMLAMIGKTEEHEYGCDDAFALLDLCAEVVARGDDPALIMPLVKRHLDLCDTCREEFEALLLAIESL